MRIRNICFFIMMFLLASCSWDGWQLTSSRNHSESYNNMTQNGDLLTMADCEMMRSDSNTIERQHCLSKIPLESYGMLEYDCILINELDFQRICSLRSFSPGDVNPTTFEKDSVWKSGKVIEINVTNYSSYGGSYQVRCLIQTDTHERWMLTGRNEPGRFCYDEWCREGFMPKIGDPVNFRATFSPDGPMFIYEINNFGDPTESGFTCLSKDNETKDQCLYFSARIHPDKDICSNILTDGMRSWCYHDVALATGNPSLCGLAGDGSPYNSCYSGLALKLKDAALCLHVHDGKNWCYRSVAVATRNASLCSLAGSGIPEDVDMCYNYVARELKTISLCLSIIDKYTKDLCFYAVAVAIGNPSLCALAGDGIASDACYGELAWMQKNESLCLSIKDLYNQEECRRRFCMLIFDITERHTCLRQILEW